jgi:acetyl esterase/lipase
MLDAEIAAALAGLPVAPVDFGSWTLAQIPELRAARAALPVPDPPPTTTIHRDIVVPGRSGGPEVPLRVYSPPQPAPNRPCILWIHGGGYIVGSARVVDVRLNRWVELLDCVVVAVDYRLAPEHPYPAALDDCDAGLSYAIANADELGIDPTRIVVIGASAGGGLAAALMLRRRDHGEPTVSAQVLIYPMLDDRHVTPSSGVAGTPVWTRDANFLGWRAYLGTEPGGPDVPVYAAPARAADLAGLPPTFVAVGSVDLFRDEDIRFASELLAAGVATELHVYDGAPHGFDVVCPGTAVSRRFDRELTEAIARALSRSMSTASQ